MNRSLFLFCSLFLLSFSAFPKDFSLADCQECHGQKGFATPDGQANKALFVATQAFQESVHGKLVCTDCHQDVEKLPHRKTGFQKVDCVGCHEHLEARWAPGKRARWLAPEPPKVVTFSRDYVLSAHGDDSVPNNASCATCHTAHYVYPSSDPRASTYRLNSPQLCGACHTKAFAEYRQSMHGQALKRPWLGDSATCSDCHSAHRVSDLSKLPAHRVVTENCGECHEEALEGYMNTPHGQLAWHGNERAPKCVDCHGGHDITHVNDPDSPVNSTNKVKTCKQCHEKANAQFAKYQPHATTTDFERYPLMWLVAKGMGGLIIFVILFFYLHSVLWFWREKKERPVIYERVESRVYPVRVKRKRPKSGVHYRRFHWAWRINHWLLALSLMTLVFSGMVVMYPNTSWAQTLVPLLGGPTVLNWIHRGAGVIFLSTVFGHAIVVLVRVLRDPNFRWFGPDSLLPRRKDWEDMKGQFRWYFGKGPQPRFDRWTYWEKFDYWAVYWGALVIGVSGLLLWFAEDVGQVLPGWVFNIATVAHGLEAFLAVMTLFVVHFFNNHFRPSKFPLDTVMFTGSWDLEEFKEERPEEYARRKASGELEHYLVKPPSKYWNLVAHILGFSLLGIGLILLILVLNGFFQSGLF